MAGRGAGRGYWFPLALLGFGLLALLGLEGLRVTRDVGWFAFAPTSPDTIVSRTVTIEGFLSPGAEYSAPGLADLPRYPMRDWPWAVVVTTTLVATLAWYGWRARRAGGSARAHVALAVGGGIAVPAGYVVAAMAETTDDPAALATSVALPLLGLGALAAVLAYPRPGRRRWVAAVLAAGCLVTGVGVLLGAWLPGLLEPVLIAAGLLVLARFERSRLLAVVAVAVLAAMTVFPIGLLSTLVPAALVLAAAIAALVRQAQAVAPA